MIAPWVFFIVILIATICAPAAAQIIQWTDEKGVTHFKNEKRAPTELESRSKLPGEQQVSIAGLIHAGIVLSMRQTTHRNVLIHSGRDVEVGPAFFKLSGANKSAALWVIVHELKRKYPKEPEVDTLAIYEGPFKILVGSYNVREGFTQKKKR